MKLLFFISAGLKVDAHPADHCPIGHYPAPNTACKGFYQCDHGVQLQTLYCPAGTLYNPEIMVCDWPNNVDCRDHTEGVDCYKKCYAGEKSQLICAKKCYGKPSSPPSDTTTAETTTQAGSSEPHCPIGHYPAPNTDCKGFYQCDHGVQFQTLYCPEGTLYNPAIMVCDWPNNVECGDHTVEIKCYKNCYTEVTSQ